jgi:hypothetical protein
MNRWIFPEQNAMLKKDGVAVRQGDVRNGDDLTLDLAHAVSEFHFGHVPQPRRFAPARIAYEIFNIQLRPAGNAGAGFWRILAMTPFADNALKRFHV